METAQMLKTHPTGGADAALAETIDALYACAQACTACADACLAEEQVATLRHCITVNLDCADICLATAATLSRQTEPDAALRRRLLEACAEACARCAAECAEHAGMHEHCRICADVCRACEERCRAALAASAAA